MIPTGRYKINQSILQRALFPDLPLSTQRELIGQLSQAKKPVDRALASVDKMQRQNVQWNGQPPAVVLQKRVKSTRMADVFMYVDETGNLDFDGAQKGSAASTYFGFGSAVFKNDHGHHLWDGLALRARLEGAGTQLAKGFHAKNDRHTVRHEVFAAIERQKPRIDTTFLCKANAYNYVRARGQMELYKLAWRLHFTEIAKQISTKDDTLYVIAGTFGTNKRSELARESLRDVCNALDRNIVLCVWESSSSWGLQVADYALWAVQRQLEQRECSWFEPIIKPQLKSYFFPWGRAS